MRLPHADILNEVERRRDRLNLALLRVYGGYCVAVALILLAVFQQAFIETRLGNLAPDLFLRIVIAYGVVNIALYLLLPRLQKTLPQFQRVVLGLVTYDILMLSMLMYASGGVSSGLGTLILVTVATSAILVTNRTANLVPALASIAVLYEEFYLSLSAPHLHDDYFQAGVLGAMYFAASLTIQFLSRRIRDKDIRALTQAAELADLEQLNNQIIRRMRTGILVVDDHENVRMLNESAREFLGITTEAIIDRVPDPIGAHLIAWRQDVEVRPAPFQINPDTTEVRASFSPIRPNEPDGDVIVFLEDAAELQQQALQLKLAALGRLSASIAHEIRNPLSAISHAAQLLRESPELAAGDQRLTEIIHKHCQRMNGIIENVLNTSRRQSPNPVRLALAPHLAKVIAAFSETMGEALIELSIEPPDLQVRIDTSQLDQVLTNLLTNAIRHSAARTGRPWVRLESGIEPLTQRPFLNVMDEGSGVEPATLDQLFEPFFTTAQGGTGLGLYLSRELCEANQARLGYHPGTNGGACFRITFAHPDRVIS